MKLGVQTTSPILYKNTTVQEFTMYFFAVH